MEAVSVDVEEEEEDLGSSFTMEKVAAAKNFIENHFKSHMKDMQQRRQRYLYLYVIAIQLNTCMQASVIFINFQENHHILASTDNVFSYFFKN